MTMLIYTTAWLYNLVLILTGRAATRNFVAFLLLTVSIVCLSIVRGLKRQKELE